MSCASTSVRMLELQREWWLISSRYLTHLDWYDVSDGKEMTRMSEYTFNNCSRFRQEPSLSQFIDIFESIIPIIASIMYCLGGGVLRVSEVGHILRKNTSWRGNRFWYTQVRVRVRV